MTDTVDSQLLRPPAQLGEGLNILKFVESDTGREIEFEPSEARQFSVKPLSFEQLLVILDNKRPSFPVEIRDLTTSSPLDGLQGKPLVVNATVQTEAPPVAYGLVDGGWLPMPWAHKDIALLDRNVVIKLEKLQGSLGEENPALLTQWLGLDTRIVSPLLFALEGSRRRPPTEFEMRAELGRAQKALRALLPGAKVQKVGPVQRAALHRLVLDQAISRTKATQFLLKAVPLVFNRAKPTQRLALEAEVARLATAEGVRRSSMTYMAVVSCIYDSKPASLHRAATPGRAILKPRMNYSAEDTYNALADLSFLEMMFNISALLNEASFVLYTADAGLAAFWAALQPFERELKQLSNGNSRTTITFNMSRGLFPDLSDEEALALSQRIAGDL